MNDTQWDVVVVGAGLAGLVAGASAAGTGAKTLILDGHGPGGRASTDERGAYRFNRGAHALYRGGPAEAVLDRLGVTVEGADPPAAGGRGRFGDRVGLLPGSTSSLLRTSLLKPRSKVALAKVLAGAAKWDPAEVAGLTIGQWLDRFDLPDDARTMMRMLVRLTTYLHDEDTVSADVPATQIPLGLGAGVRYLHGGWATMVDGLTRAATDRGAEVAAGFPVTGVVPAGDRFTVRGRETELSAKAVVLATGTPAAAASLLADHPATWKAVGPAVEASCLDLGMPQRLEPAIFLGIDRPIYLIDHAASARDLAPEGAGLVHILRYLGLGEATDARILRAEMEEHARAAGIDPQAAVEHRFLRRMTVTGATPTPAQGGLAGRPAHDSIGLPGLTVAGDWVGPSGWLADASFASGEVAGVAAGRHANSILSR
jgi:phytoene dehydrogenase-like protein